MESRSKRSWKTSPLPSRFLLLGNEQGAASLSLYRRDRSQITRLFRLSLPGDWDHESPAILGESLRNVVASQGWNGESVLVAIPRRQVVLKNLTVPEHAGEDIAEIVHLQSEQLFPVQKKELEIDFLEHISKDGTHHLVIAAVPKTILQRNRSILATAGLKPIGFGIPQLGVPRLRGITNELHIERSKSNRDELLWKLSPNHPFPSRLSHVGNQSVDALVDEQSTELIYTHTDTPIVSYTIPYSAEAADRLQSVLYGIAKIVESIGSKMELPPPTELRLWGSIPNSWKKRIETEIGMRTVTASEEDLETIRELGLIAGHSESKGIDFLHPRKPVDRKRESRNKAVFYAALATTIVLVSAIPIWREHSTLDSQIAMAMERKSLLETRLQRYQPIALQWEKWSTFSVSRRDIAIEIEQLLSELPSSNELCVESIEVQTIPNQGELVVKLKGGCVEREKIQSLTDTLLLQGDRYRVRPPLVEANRKDRQYPFLFSLEVEVIGIEKGNANHG